MWRKPNEANPIPPRLGIPPVAVAPATAPAAPIYQPAVAKIGVANDTPARTSIGSGLRIHGELSGTSDLYIDGEALGKITLRDSQVTVGPNGRVQADIEAREILVEGNVEGNLKARESVRLGSSCQVQGSIVTARIGIDDGARLRGKVEMTRVAEAQPSPSSATVEQPAAVSSYQIVHAASEND
jgi:cytoskeletal protein CcmA (bactofilin family)